jgi:hypothetical protein
MLMTRKEFNSPLSKLSVDADEQLWEGVALVFQKQWVMLSLRHIQVDRNGGKENYFKTIFLNNFSSILNKKFMAKKGESIEFVSGYILLPRNEKAKETFDRWRQLQKLGWQIAMKTPAQSLNSVRPRPAIDISQFVLLTRI